MREAWAGRWREWRACRLWWGLTGICRRCLGGFIRSGRRRGWRFWCRQWVRGLCFCSGRSATARTRRIRNWWMGILGFTVVLGGIVLSLIPPAEAENKWIFEGKLAGGSAFAILFGLMLYYRGARAKAREARAR